MALSFYNGKSFSQLPIYRENIGGDVYLYLPGPSLNVVDGVDINVPGAIKVGVNTSYPKIKPDIWMGMDNPKCYNHMLAFEPFMKIFRHKFANHDIGNFKLKELSGNYFVATEEPTLKENEIFMSLQDGSPVLWFQHTLAGIIHVLIRMGAKKIHMVGCDLGGDKDYYDDRVLDPILRKNNRFLYNQQIKFLKRVVRIGKQFGVEFISCTPNSPINEYMEFKELLEALKQTSEKYIVEEHNIKHVDGVTADVRKKIISGVDWMGAEDAGSKGVLVALDKNLEWMLEWWYENYSKYNDYPIAFVDLGMTKKGIKFCRSKGLYFKLPDIAMEKWFLKPYALKLTPFEYTVYMDLDCEVRTNIDDLFLYSYHGFSISDDVVNQYSKVDNPVNTGVIAYHQSNDVINNWAECTMDNVTYHRSDQDILDMVLLHHKELKCEKLPHSCHRMRLLGDTDEDVVIFHYTGDKGKELIKQKINEY